jgi:hypothetical protein
MARSLMCGWMALRQWPWVIRCDAGSDSEAPREAAARRRAKSSLVAEVERLAADEGDREEMRVVREQLAELAPDPVD